MVFDKDHSVIGSNTQHFLTEQLGLYKMRFKSNDLAMKLVDLIYLSLQHLTYQYVANILDMHSRLGEGLFLGLPKTDEKANKFVWNAVK